MLRFSEGCAFVKKDDKYGYINKYGKVIVDFIYDEAYFFYAGVGGCKVGV